MSTENKVLILDLLDIALNIGIPAVTQYVETVNKTNITAEDIAVLRTKIKQNPEEYFK